MREQNIIYEDENLSIAWFKGNAYGGTKCDKCGERMGKDAKRLCHTCQSTANLMGYLKKRRKAKGLE